MYSLTNVSTIPLNELIETLWNVNLLNSDILGIAFVN